MAISLGRENNGKYLRFTHLMPPQKKVKWKLKMKRTRSFRVEIITFRFHVGFSNAVRFAKSFFRLASCHASLPRDFPLITCQLMPQELKKFMQRSSALQEVPSDGFGFQGINCV